MRNFNFGKKLTIAWKAFFALPVTAGGERVTLVADGDGEPLSKKKYIIIAICLNDINRLTIFPIIFMFFFLAD